MFEAYRKIVKETRIKHNIAVQNLLLQRDGRRVFSWVECEDDKITFKARYLEDGEEAVGRGIIYYPIPDTSGQTEPVSST